jgi:para-nitrobenzyl esterase
MRFIKLAGVALAMSPTLAFAQAAPPAAAAHYSTAATQIGTLLDDPAAKAIVLKYIPAMANNPQIDMARGLTLRDTQQFAPDMVTDKALTQIDAELAKLPSSK